MSYQTACPNCGVVYNDLLPIPKNNRSMVLKCNQCSYQIIEIFGNDHRFTSMVRARLNEEKIHDTANNETKDDV